MPDNAAARLPLGLGRVKTAEWLFENDREYRALLEQAGITHEDMLASISRTAAFRKPPAPAPLPAVTARASPIGPPPVITSKEVDAAFNRQRLAARELKAAGGSIIAGTAKAAACRVEHVLELLETGDIATARACLMDLRWRWSDLAFEAGDDVPDGMTEVHPGVFQIKF
jgi:hypothetical protein